MKVQEIPRLPMADISARDAAGQILLELAGDNPDIWALTADVKNSTGLVPFSRAFPERFLNVGIAEQTMMGVAAGLATCGKIPFAATFAFLASMRCCEQVRTDIAYPQLNVKIYATHAGLALATGGTTHHATEDLAIMRSFANMTVVVPADVPSTHRMMHAIVERPGPVYLRLRRGPAPIVYQEDFDYQIGRAGRVRSGDDVTLIGCGRTVAECLVAALILEDEGVSAAVLDMHTLKPIDAEAIAEAAAGTRLIVTAEDHSIIGGLGGAVGEVLAELGSGTALKRLGIRDTYAGIGPESQLLERHGLTGPAIAQVVRGALG
jgi:transketolase